MPDRERLAWNTVSTSGCTTYDAFSLPKGMTVGDLLTYSKHLRVIEDSDGMRIEHLLSNWDDVFVAPAAAQMLDMDGYYVNILVSSIVIHHIYTIVLMSGRFTISDLIDLALRELGTFEFGSAKAGRFLVAVGLLSRTSSQGARIVKQLANESVTESFEKLLPRETFEDADYLDYQPDRPGSKAQKLILPSWVRNRIAHPENRHERKFPSDGQIRRATGMIYAASLALRYQTDPT